MKHKNYKRPYFELSVLSCSMLLLSANSHALQALDDHDLRRVDGQDGVQITTGYDAVDIDQLYWQDKAGSAGAAAGSAGVEKDLRAYANGVKIRDTNTTDGLGLGTTIKIDAGSNGTTPGLNLQLISNPSTISVDSFKICEASTVCNDASAALSLGRLAFQTTSLLTLGLVTKDGVFSEDSQSQLILGLNSANIFLGQQKFGSATLNNQLILKNLNFNFVGLGAMFVTEAGGLRLQTNIGSAVANSATDASGTRPNATYGYVDFTRVVDSSYATLSNNGTYVQTTVDGNCPTGNCTTNAGLNLEIMTKRDVDITAANPYNLTGAKGLIRVGANGRIVNGFLQVRGVSGSGVGNPSNYGISPGNIVGFATSQTNTTPSTSTVTNANGTIIGSTGIGFRMRGEFTKDNDAMLNANAGNPAGQATTLEIGGAGLNTLGFEFGNLSALRSDLTDRAYFDSGNIFINLADTRHLLMPENYNFQTSRFGNGQFLTTSADYIQEIYKGSGANPYSTVIAVRGMDFQAISRRGRFTSSSNVDAAHRFLPTDGINNKWGLALPFYNVNANMAMYATTSPAGTVIYKMGATDCGSPTAVCTETISGTQRLGFSMALSAEGIDKDFSRTTGSADYLAKGYNVGNKTTSILVIDGATNTNNVGGAYNKPTDYYMGLRNVDMLLRGTGTMGVENGNLNISLPDLLIVMAGEVAAGYLPGAKYKTCPNSTGGADCFSPTDNFALKKDVLFGLKLRLAGAMNLSLIPNNEIAAVNGNRLSVLGDLTLSDTGKSTIQISDPVNGSILGLDNITGKVAFNNAIVIDRDSSTGNGNVSFNAAFTFNPNNAAAEVVRVRDVNFYPPSSGAGQRLGEIAITGGTLSSTFKITPRN